MFLLRIITVLTEDTTLHQSCDYFSIFSGIQQFAAGVLAPCPYPVRFKTKQKS